MNEKLKQLKELLASTDGTGSLMVPIADLRELLATVEAVTAPNMQLALQRFQTHVDMLNGQIQRQVESINRLLAIAEEAKRAARGK